MIDQVAWSYVLLLTVLLAVSAKGQNASLYLIGNDPSISTARKAGNQSGGFAAIAEVSDMAVHQPHPPPSKPKKFAVNDLVTIIIREFTKADSTAELETEKNVAYESEISDFPDLQLNDLLRLQLQASKNEKPPKLSLSYRGKFDGEGDYKREDSITGRMTGTIIDVKPNGNIVLEARKYIEQDDETLGIMVTGICRAVDVTIDNTILSTQLFDLRLRKYHTGELRNTTKKGLLSKLFDLVFDF